MSEKLMRYKHRFTPEVIDSLEEDQIFVFGSNERGIHGGGAAKLAYEKFYAVHGRGFGRGGYTYAIPTKSNPHSRLSLSDIGEYVDVFINEAERDSFYRFLVTKIGCGLAGYTVDEIAPLFRNALHVENIFLPMEFFRVILSEEE
jgi:hypothetical protein